MSALTIYDTSKLRGRIIEKFGSQNDFATVAHCSTSFLSQYLNGKTFLTQPVMDNWIRLLEIADCDIRAYFFIPKVHEMEQK